MDRKREKSGMQKQKNPGYAGDHERMRRAGVGSTNYNIAINSPLRSRDAILKNKHNKRRLRRMLSTFDMGAAVTIDTQDTAVFGHQDAFVTIIRYVLQVLIRASWHCGLHRPRRIEISHNTFGRLQCAVNPKSTVWLQGYAHDRYADRQ